MNGSLARLLPLHDARERRALRQSHEHSLAHERALAVQVGAARLVQRLAQDHEKARDHALGGKAIVAADALAAIEHAAVLAARLVRARESLATRTEAADRALELARSARQAYANLVRVNHMVRDAARAQNLAQSQLQNAAQALRDDDDYTPVWWANQAGRVPVKTA